ncbi:hypothetical protein O7543_04895 [Solwaraspora sp. WMMA2080]|uniref:hypothetical protein n=1 Tax=unclassified Solwaraspora TaxID=2627926 RepID=UPI00248BC987|nr:MULTISPECIES: hypothetical protein [unclassified Solwaraspora]WBB99632.1 hypothetical protein O7553_12475 [Solwaraspora sp. WMMA2059]WBC21818.1 hypothetical protein O7543_04895 [Solwaraspora sp. WMMA2080]WJK36134.1 hypothetical protein O7610_07220 [Solwaraspora sp. WMMA2065]
MYRQALYYHGGTAAHHGDRPYPMCMNVPGLKIIVPSNGPDLKGLLRTAIRDDNPVLCFEDANLWARRGRGPAPADDEHLVPFGVTAIPRAGSDVAVIGIGGGPRCRRPARRRRHLRRGRRPTHPGPDGLADHRRVGGQDRPRRRRRPGQPHLQRGQRDRRTLGER